MIELPHPVCCRDTYPYHCTHRVIISTRPRGVALQTLFEVQQTLSDESREHMLFVILHLPFLVNGDLHLEVRV